jgi:hypothetical protein
MQVKMLGRAGTLKWTSAGQDIVVETPPAPSGAAEAQWAYVLKLPGLKTR